MTGHRVSRFASARLCLLAGVASCVATAAVAQPAPATQLAANDAPDASAVQGDAILVTARRRVERLMDAPVAITALGGAALDTYAATSVTDIATFVPGLVAGQATSGSGASIFLRGVGSSSLSAGFDQSVSFVLDGMPMSRGREINIAQYDLRSIEVLKGPQALFFGKNATGGLIVLNINNPTDQLEASVRAGYGFEARDKYTDGYVSGPLADGLRGRIAWHVADSDGALTNTAALTYIDPLGMERHRNSARRGGSRTYSGRLTLEWDATSALSFQLKAGYTDYKDGGPSDYLERVCGSGRTTPFAAGGIPPSPNADCAANGRSDSSTIPVEIAEANYRYAGDGHMYSHLKSGYGILTANIESDIFNVTSITSYYRFKQTDLNNVSGEAYPAGFSQLADYRQFSEELRFQSAWEGPVSALFGFFGSSNKFIFNTDAYFLVAPIDPVNGTATTFKRDNGFTGNSLSAFGELTVNFTDQLELSGGARWSNEERNSFQQSLPANSLFAGLFPGGIHLEDRYRQSNVSPQATLRYKPSADLTLYAAYKEGFKSGGFNISQPLSPDITSDTGRFRAETARGGEIGARSMLLNGSLSLNATAYYYDYRNLQVQSFDPVTVGMVVANAGTLRVKGIEGDFSWRSGGFALHGSAAYNDATYHDYIGQCYNGQTIADGCNLLAGPGGDFTSQNYEGRTPPKAPRFAGRLGADYQLPLGTSGWNLLASGDASYTSKYNYNDTLRPDSIQRAYTLLNASLRLNAPNDRWTLALIGRNLTNKYAVSSANDIPLAGGTGTGTNGPGVLADMSVAVANPREIYIEAGFKF